MKQKFGIQPSPKSLFDLSNMKAFPFEKPVPYESSNGPNTQSRDRVKLSKKYDRFKDSVLLKTNLPSNLGPGVYENQTDFEGRRGKFFRQGKSKSIFEEIPKSQPRDNYDTQPYTQKKKRSIQIERCSSKDISGSSSMPETNQASRKLGMITISHT
mmetsp:Transcript_21345/g.20490  ORF Transcript_21345/g.20490 Transcript_21345/m.20490 type:complete len:156 (+) Transcript_21345:1062-1529(+)